MISAELRMEALRKVFHLLSLIYLAAFHHLGRDLTIRLLAGWILLEGAVEAVRLRVPYVNETLIAMFCGIHREEETNRVSGILWTSIGCLLTMVCFGDRPLLVDAALLYLAFGDMAAAMVGKAFGRVNIGFWGRKKTLEGSVACLAVCAAAGLAAGLSPAAALAGAVTATAIEIVPVPLNDNFWMPIGAAFVLSFF
ncbi:MAG: hypothetical protein HY078_09910 [Elusimicrobia bacterium]|nr:hypothetical protein [Elusimicrobiota bacterium]